MSRFMWVRRMIGGKWGRVTGLMWGYNWIMLSPEALMFDEDWDAR